MLTPAASTSVSGGGPEPVLSVDVPAPTPLPVEPVAPRVPDTRRQPNRPPAGGPEGLARGHFSPGLRPARARAGAPRIQVDPIGPDRSCATRASSLARVARRRGGSSRRPLEAPAPERLIA